MSEPYVRPDVRQFLDWLNTLPGPKTYEAGPVEARRMMVASRYVVDAPTGELAVIRDLAWPGPAGEIRLRLFHARGSPFLGAPPPASWGPAPPTRRSRSAPRWRASWTCPCSPSTTGWRPNTRGRPAWRTRSQRRAGRRRARQSSAAK